VDLDLIDTKETGVKRKRGQKTLSRKKNSKHKGPVVSSNYVPGREKESWVQNVM
jgi:hypothetical protein